MAQEPTGTAHTGVTRAREAVEARSAGAVGYRSGRPRRRYARAVSMHRLPGVAAA